MKFIIISIIAATLIGAVIGSYIPESQPEVTVEAIEDMIEPTRFRKSIYSKRSYSQSHGPSYTKSYKQSYAPKAPVYAAPTKTYNYPSPAPHVPCSKNLLFSCEPSVAAVPCSVPSYSSPAYSAPLYSGTSYSTSSYGGHGAYSEQIPQYTIPFYRELY